MTVAKDPRCDSAVSGIKITVTVRPEGGDELDEDIIELQAPSVSELRKEARIQAKFELPNNDFTISIHLKKNNWHKDKLTDLRFKKILAAVASSTEDIRFEFAQTYKFKVVNGSTPIVVVIGELNVAKLRKEARDSFPELTEFSLQYGEPRVKLNECPEIGASQLAEWFQLESVQGKLPTAFVVVPGSVAPSVVSSRETVAALAAPSSSVDKLPESHFDCMLSYSWSTKEQVLKIKQLLEETLGIKVWVDETEMKGDIYLSMAEAILKSDRIIICLSKPYLESTNCELELKYAADLKKRLICVYMFDETDDISKLMHSPKLAAPFLITAGKLYIDFKNSLPPTKEWEQAFPQLVKQVSSELGLNRSSQSNDPLEDWLKPIDFQGHKDAFLKQYIPGTRTWIAEPLNLWFTSQETMSWLNGAAGTGKSMISWLVAERKQVQFADYQTGSVFFCCHNDDSKRDPSRVVCTMAWDLSRLFPSVKKVVETVLLRDQKDVAAGLTSILCRPIEAFKFLIVDGLNTLPVDGQKPILLIVDALDECNPATRRHLLTILTETSKLLPPFVKFFATGRPEEDIYDAMESIQPFILQPTSKENLRDLELFARLNFRKLLGMDDIPFDQDADARTCVSQFVSKSEGLFIWGKCVCEHLGSLDITSSAMLLEKLNAFDSGCDETFEHIILRASTEASDMTDFRRNLAIILATVEPVTLPTLAALGGWGVTEVGKVVSKLRSILNLDGTVVTIVHKSLRDFLVDGSRSGALCISMPDCNLHVARRCLEILTSTLSHNMANLDPSQQYVPSTSNVGMSRELAYAVKHWAAHLLETNSPEALVEPLFHFFESKFANWMEAMLLLGRRGEIVRIAVTLDPLLANLSTGDASFVFKISTIRSLLNDSKYIAINFLVPLEFNPLQLYSTAGVWAKKNCEFFKRFHDSHAGFQFLIGHEKDWGPLTFLGHSGPVRSATFSHDGKRVLSASGDKTVKVWLLDGSCCMTLEGHEDGVSCASFTKDDKMIVSGSVDGTLKGWRAMDGWPTRSVNHGGEINAIAVSDKMIASVGAGGVGKLWYLESWESAFEFGTSGCDAHTVAFSWDGILLAYAGDDGKITVINVESKKCIRVFNDTSAVNSVAFSRDGRFLASGNADGQTKLWSLSAEPADACSQTFVFSEGDAVHGVAITAASDNVVATDIKGRVNVFNIAMGSCKSFQFHTFANLSVAVSSNAALQTEAIAVANIDNVINLLSWNTPVPQNSLEDGIHAEDVEEVAFAEDSSAVRTVQLGGAVETWSLPDGYHAAAAANGATFRKEMEVKAGFELTSDSWVVDASGKKLMFVPVYANGHISSKGKIIVLRKGGRIYALEQK
ncbi:hypothetical protein HDU98_008900 [Podochytrium sp. JEL0797]|nr:hypothetical protein HDU98_008900 [Podochytrium sp. JEL0797]